MQGLDTSYLWPFRGKKQLPTKDQVLCLYFFIRGQEKMKKVPQCQVLDPVLDEVTKCWKLANIPTKVYTTLKRDLQKILSTRDNLVKNKHKMSEKEVEKRNEFENSLQKLWDVSSIDANLKIKADRLHDEFSKTEDQIFLLDQQGDRKMELGDPDNRYIEASLDQISRKETEANKEQNWKIQRKDGQ